MAKRPVEYSVEDAITFNDALMQYDKVIKLDVVLQSKFSYKLAYVRCGSHLEFAINKRSFLRF